MLENGSFEKKLIIDVSRCERKLSGGANTLPQNGTNGNDALNMTKKNASIKTAKVSG